MVRGMSASIDDKFAELGEAIDVPGRPKMKGSLDLYEAAKPFGAQVLSSEEFVHGFVAPDYVIDCTVQRHRLYSCTAKTGDGKTAVMLRLLASVALGRTVGGCDVEQGNCLMLVGENPDDVRMRWIALSEQMGFLVSDINVHFMPGIFPIADLMPLLFQKTEEVGPLSLIGVDTGAAYFEGDDENSNTQMGDYARKLRTLTDLPGLPAAIVNTHPVKGAAAENLVPRGGGAFLNEVDGNLTCKKTDTSVELHWYGKFRGPDFMPIQFELMKVTSDRLKDSKGRHLPTVIARPLSNVEHASRENAVGRDLHTLLATMGENRGVPVSALAEKSGWMSASGEPQKSKVHRLLETLKAQKLAVKELNNWVLTAAGEKTAKKTIS